MIVICCYVVASRCNSACVFYRHEPQREKTYLQTCAYNEGSSQPTHPRSLVRVFILRIKKLYILCYPNTVTKTCLYNFDPLKPYFYVVKLGTLQGYIISFLFLLKNKDCGYSLEPPRRGGSNDYPQYVFDQKYETYRSFFI